MVYESKSLKLCHQLTDEGKQHYCAVVKAWIKEQEWIKAHPILAFIKRLICMH